MKRSWLMLTGSLCAFGLIAGVAFTRAADRAATPLPAPAPVMPAQQAGWLPRAGLQQLPLWPGAAPNMTDAPPPPESTRTGVNPRRFAGFPVTGVFNVSKPTMTIYPARAPTNGGAVIVFPGGGFQQLAIDLEGTEACDWLAAKGFVCVLVKYRVPNSNHHYDEGCDCAVTPKHLLALQDAQRAIRLVRARARTLRIDPHKIGVIGFSAGGYLVAQTSNIFAPAYKPVDAVDRVSSRPDFALALYPGHLCRAGGKLDPGIHVSGRTPPTFLVQAWDDPTDPVCNSTVYARALDTAGVPTEAHLFAKGGHAFGLRRTDGPVVMWPTLAEHWLRGIGVM